MQRQWIMAVIWRHGGVMIGQQGQENSRHL
jgi:hypothetical protein